MKEKTHPEYRPVLFVDTATGFKFVCGSTVKSDKTEEFEGKEYPVVTLAISSTSHPFFAGSKQFVDTEGRVDKFKKRYEAKPKVEAKPAPVVEKPKKAPAKKKK